MKSRWIIGLGLVATLAMSVLTASAFAVRHRQPRGQLTLATAKGPLPGGADIVAASSDLTTTTVAGALKCSESVLTGKLRSIKPAQGTVGVRRATATGGEPDGGCTSPLGEADITALNLPWTLTLDRNGSGVLASTSKLAFKATFPTLGGLVCTFEAAKITTHFPLSKRAKPLELTASDQVFTRDTATSSPACPTSGEMNGHFAVTSRGKPVLAYIR